MQENTHISCIRDDPPYLSTLLKLDEKAPIYKNLSENFLHRGGSTMTTQAVARRRSPRDTHPKGSDSSARTKKLPEYLEAHEVEAIIRASDNPRAKLLMLEQWRAGLRIGDAQALEVSDLSLDAEPPTLRVRAGKGNRSKIVPMHRELQTALRAALTYGSIDQIKLATFTPRRHGAGSGRRSGGLRNSGRSCPGAR